MNVSEFYDVSEVPSNWKFQILGHGERTGKYPDWVVPIGILHGESAAVYLQGSGIVRASYDPKLDEHVKYHPDVIDSLSGFNYREHFLFAYSVNEITYHDEAGRLEFVRKILSEERFQGEEPFVRLSIAHASKEPELILNEMKNCARSLGKNHVYLQDWFKSQIELARTPENLLGLDMPDLAKQLEEPGTLDSMLMGH